MLICVGTCWNLSFPISRHHLVETDIEAEELKPSDNEMQSTLMSVPASALWQYLGNVAIVASCLLILLRAKETQAIFCSICAINILLLSHEASCSCLNWNKIKLPHGSA